MTYGNSIYSKAVRKAIEDRKTVTIIRNQDGTPKVFYNQKDFDNYKVNERRRSTK